MTRDRVETFADRLPPVVPKVEEDIEGLSDELVEILYPGRRQKPFSLSVVFDDSEDDAVMEAKRLSARAASFTTFQEGSITRHRADFETEQASLLRDVASLVGARPGSEILVAGRKAPYGHELWLPLMFFFVTAP
ncbi:MAG: hypothetical protein JJE39_01665 [Vicinamibacteria bacterium]|nr:hypothetical protein [Vicinamibacteria bacterium]